VDKNENAIIGMVFGTYHTGKGCRTKYVRDEVNILQTNQNIKIPEKIDIRDLQGKGQTILIIDDDDLMREFLQEILSLNGYNILTARNSKRAQILFNSTSDQIDLILTDLELVGVEQLISFVVRRDLKPVLLYTDHYTPVSTSKSISGFEIIEKPFDIVQLFKYIHTLTQVDSSLDSIIISSQISC